MGNSWTALDRTWITQKNIVDRLDSPSTNPINPPQSEIPLSRSPTLR